MKASDRAILLGFLIAGLLAAFWFLLLSPKREDASKLADEIATVQSAISEQQELLAAAEQAKSDYKRNYHRMVVLGKAVPGDEDSASLIEQTQTLADRAGIEFRTLRLSEGGATAPVPGTAETTADPPAEGTATPPATGTTTAAAPATEAGVAVLPIGATAGPAGLPVMPYDMSFRGDFFEIADFMAGLDRMVRTKANGIGVDGRLLTVDGFVLSPDLIEGFPYLKADLHVTSFVTPADQGLTAGATQTAPDAAAASATVPATPSTSPTPTPAATAAAPAQ